MNQSVIKIITILTLVGMTTLSNASVMTFNDESEFRSIVGNVVGENFNNINEDLAFDVDSQTFNFFTLSNSLSNPNSSDINFIDASPFRDFDNNSTVNSTTFVSIHLNTNLQNPAPANGFVAGNQVEIYFDTAITSFGASFRGFNDGGTTGISLDSAVPFLPTVANGFFGFISSTPFNSLRFRATANDTFSADDFIFNAIPEPASLALFGLGLAGVIATRKRRIVYA